MYSFILEDEERISELSESLKGEKQKRKNVENKFSNLQEELSDLKSSTEILEKVNICTSKITQSPRFDQLYKLEIERGMKIYVRLQISTCVKV